MHDKMKIYGVTDYFILADYPTLSLNKKNVERTQTAKLLKVY